MLGIIITIIKIEKVIIMVQQYYKSTLQPFSAFGSSNADRPRTSGEERPQPQLGAIRSQCHGMPWSQFGNAAVIIAIIS